MINFLCQTKLSQAYSYSVLILIVDKDINAHTHTIYIYNWRERKYMCVVSRPHNFETLRLWRFRFACCGDIGAEMGIGGSGNEVHWQISSDAIYLSFYPLHILNVQSTRIRCSWMVSHSTRTLEWCNEKRDCFSAHLSVMSMSLQIFSSEIFFGGEALCSA